MRVLKDAWYVAAWSADVTNELLGRTILGEPVLLYRKQDGGVAAIGNRCPHRFAPLHLGKLVGDLVQCGYHGLRFDDHGRCVENPVGNCHVPKNAVVPCYRVVERHELIWIWMGEPERADDTTVPDYSIIDDPGWAHAIGGYIHCNANYELMVDNLMDLSHVAFVHPKFGNESMAAGALDVKRNGEAVHANLWMAGSDVPPYLQDRFDGDGHIDQWLDMKWQAPANLIINYGATLPGQPREHGFSGWGIHFLTPETETSAHYHFGIFRKQAPGAEEAVVQDHEAQKTAFGTEDKPMVESCQAMMGTADFRSMKPIILGSDAAAMQVRAVLEKMIQAESPGGP